MSIYIDFETRSECDLKKAGAWAYAQHPSTEILCMAWVEYNHHPQLWTPHEDDRGQLPFDISAGIQLESHNAFFEAAIWENIMVPKYGWEPIPQEQWSCSAAKCAAHSLPRALDQAGAALLLDVRKNQEGKALMMKMCKPRKATKLDKSKWHEKPEDFEKLYAYCKDDVLAEMALSRSLRPLNETETKVWQLDQQINKRGIAVDMEAVERCIDYSDRYAKEMNEPLSELTGGVVTAATQTKRIVEWAQTQGANLDSVKKEDLEDALANPALPERVREVLEVRKKVGKTSVAKYKKIKLAANKDNRLMGLFRYCGAGPGRWAGQIVQSQNLPRPALTDKGKIKYEVETCINIMKQGSYDTFKLCYPDVMDAVSSCIRGMFICTEGKTLFGGDYSSIEARVLPWLAGDDSALDVFRSGRDVYKDMATDIYGILYEAVTKTQRQLGKQAILGLGYQMGAERFVDTCAQYGIVISIEEAQRIVDIYRDKYCLIKKFWYDMEAAAIKAFKNKGSFVKNGKIGWGMDGDFLCCKLPSKRLISYYKPELGKVTTPWGKKKSQLSYMHLDSMTRKFVRTSTYGGKIVENITQGVARDVMVEGMFKLEDAGYQIVMHTHDETMSEKAEGSVEEYERLMGTNPAWGLDIPLVVEGWTGNRYGK